METNKEITKSQIQALIIRAAASLSTITAAADEAVKLGMDRTQFMATARAMASGKDEKEARRIGIRAKNRKDDRRYKRFRLEDSV